MPAAEVAGAAAVDDAGDDGVGVDPAAGEGGAEREEQRLSGEDLVEELHHGAFLGEVRDGLSDELEVAQAHELAGDPDGEAGRAGPARTGRDGGRHQGKHGG